MQEKDYKPYFHAVLTIHATFMVLIWLLIITVLLPAYHKNIKTNEDFVYEFNTTVGQDLYQRNMKAIDNTSEPMPDSVFLYEFNQFFGPEPYKTSVLEIQAIAPRYKFKPEEWAILWTFADRYNIAKFPTYTGDRSEQHEASQNFLEQILTAHEYIMDNDMDKESLAAI